MSIVLHLIYFEICDHSSDFTLRFVVKADFHVSFFRAETDELLHMGLFLWR